MPDEFFDAAEVISDFINVPASVQRGGSSERYLTLTDALGHLREHGLADASLIIHALGGDRQFSDAQVTALVDTLPDPMGRGN